MRDTGVLVEDVEEEAGYRDRGRRVWLVLFLALVAGVLLGVNILYGLVFATRHDETYCVTCHQYQGPASMWVQSHKHAEWMTCPQCHGLLPGQKGRRGAFSAHPETVNPNCMGCHTRIVEGKPLGKMAQLLPKSEGDGGEEQPLYEWKLEDLMYRWHLQKRVCLCTDCHRNVAHEKEAGATGRTPKMAYCRNCHYHAVKDDYVQMRPVPNIKVRDLASVQEE